MGQARRYYALQGGWVGQKRPILALRNYAMAPYIKIPFGMVQHNTKYKI